MYQQTDILLFFIINASRRKCLIRESYSNLKISLKKHFSRGQPLKNLNKSAKKNPARLFLFFLMWLMNP